MDINTQVPSTDDNAEIISAPIGIPPPPPPPLLNLNLPQEMVVDKYIEKRLKKMEAFDGNTSNELSKKMKKIEEVESSAMTEGEGTGEGLKDEYEEGKVLCQRCEHWFQPNELKSHNIQHSSQILDFLFLGSAYNSNNLKELTTRTNISYILNIAAELNNVYPDQFVYKKIEIEDSIDVDISAYFKECIEFIEQAKSENKNILVHCIQGISRSASIVLVYLMHCGKSLKESFDLVKSKRFIVRPNVSFVKGLLKYELKLFNHNSCEGSYLNSTYVTNNNNNNNNSN